MLGIPKHAKIVSTGNTPTRYAKRHLDKKPHLSIFTKKHTRGRSSKIKIANYKEYQISCQGVAKAMKNYFQTLNRQVTEDQKAVKALKRSIKES